MSHGAIVTFTARNLQWILDDGGSRDWRLDADRARHSVFLVCTQNRNNAGFGAPTAAHGHAFLIGRISGIVPSPDRPDRWLIKISEYIACDIPNIWGKHGHLRYPVWYTTLEELGIDLDALPPFERLPSRGRASGMSDVASPPLMPPKEWPTMEWPPNEGPPKEWPVQEWAATRAGTHPEMRPGTRAGTRPSRPPAAAATQSPGHHPAPTDPDAWARLDAILAQLDRVPDLPGPADPLDWDEHGLPR
jgi:hypothetical protein